MNSTDGKPPNKKAFTLPEARRDNGSPTAEPAQPGREGPEGVASTPSVSRTLTKVETDPKTGRITGSPGHSAEIVQAVEAEWRMGLKSISQISRELGPSRNTIYGWAREHGWPDRDTSRQAAQRQITAEVVRQTVADYRGREPTTADQRSLEEQLRDLQDADPDAPPESVLRSELVWRDYATAVAMVIRSQQQTADKAAEIGQSLLELFHLGVRQLREKYKDGTDHLAKLKLVAGITKEYATLVRALQMAATLQRQAHAIDHEQVRDPDESPAATASSNPAAPAQPGSYEDTLAEAERRELRLS